MAGLAIVKYSLFSQEKYTDARYKHQTLEVASTYTNQQPAIDMAK
jgi:hypothetical protein